MRVVRVHEFGPPEVLRLEEAEAPEAVADQVVVAVEAAGVVFGDIVVRSGRHPFPVPYVPGLEVGGRVVEVGPDADPALLGQLVVAATADRSGGYAERAVAGSGQVFAVPRGLPVEQALAVFQAGAVALGLLEVMEVGPGDTVLVTAAAGRIGSLLVQLAAAAGARVVAAARGAAKLDLALRLGAAAAVDYDSPDWVERVRAATGGRGADVVLDAIGGELGRQAALAAAGGTGRLGVYGFTSGSWTDVGSGELAGRGVTGSRPLTLAFRQPAGVQRARSERALAQAAAGRLVPVVDRAFPLERAAAAHHRLEQRRSAGAVLLTP
ncbi:zinc-binding dehydrogenase [Streptacidiphilus griseoplanus]|uniref:zinc-binding dehydrogenase n=1 Tax=Peterkaempfera griseoplana TaxID=66896 RepID=UPI0006E33AFC|nr:zinc-binding dehydrogenase [Peterkaempfera griseoplana]